MVVSGIFSGREGLVLDVSSRPTIETELVDAGGILLRTGYSL
jgi:hypothetical protein